MLAGTATRRSAPYPRPLVERIVSGYVETLQATGKLGYYCSRQARQCILKGKGSTRIVNGIVTPDEYPSGAFFEAMLTEGVRRINQLRHGAARATPATSDPPAPPDPPTTRGERAPDIKIEMKRSEQRRVVGIGPSPDGPAHEAQAVSLKPA